MQQQLEEKRRGGAQDQDQGMVADFYYHCKLIHLEINKEYFSRPNARVLYVLFNLCLISNPLVEQ